MEIMARGFAMSRLVQEEDEQKEGEEAEKTGTSVADVPDECLAAVFRLLPSHEDRNSAALTCRKWRALEAMSRHTLRYVREFAKPCDENLFLVDRLMYALRTFPHILSLAIIRYTRLPDEFFHIFENKGFSQLNAVHLHFCLAITDKTIDFLTSGCPNLTQVSLARCESITDAGLHAIARAYPRLEYLDVSYCKHIRDAGIDDVLGSCPNVQDLIFSYCFEVDGWGLRRGKKLKKVQAEACVLTDAGLVEGLEGARSIETLCMADLRSGVRLGASGLGKLGASCSNLEVLCLRMCRVLDDATIERIAQGCPNMRVWDLSRSQEVTVTGWQAVSRFCFKLQHLDVNRCRQFCDMSLFAIQEACPILQRFYITGCPLLSIEACDQFRAIRSDVHVDNCGVLTTACCHIN